MTARFRLPPEVFDALHLSALANGGIGAGRYYEKWSPEQGHHGAPVCYIGHMADLGIVEDTGAWEPFGIGEHTNDVAVRQGKHGFVTERVSFKRWCALDGVDVEEVGG